MPNATRFLRNTTSSNALSNNHLTSKSKESESRESNLKAKAAFDDAELVLSTFLVELKGEIDLIDPELEEYRFIDENYSEEGINLPDSIKDHVIPFCIKEGLLSWKI